MAENTIRVESNVDSDVDYVLRDLAQTLGIAPMHISPVEPHGEGASQQFEVRLANEHEVKKIRELVGRLPALSEVQS